MQRFRALDSWRGICACLVVIFHFRGEINWSFREADWTSNLFLFVDFFFVLSGFVIASSYRGRLTRGFGVGRFALLRLARLYPLHLATLATVAVFAFLTTAPDKGLTRWFEGDLYSERALLTNLLLLQGIGFENHLTWNHPSWSISAEFYTYLLFALIWTLFGRAQNWIVIATLVIAPLLYLVVPREVPSIFTLIRCVYGFAAGVATFDLFQRLRMAQMPRLTATLLEIGVAAACVLFVTWEGSDRWTAAAPPLFALAVCIFAFEAGAVSRALLAPPAQMLGALSYSIYMTHVVFLLLAWSLIDALERATGWPITIVAADGARLLGAEVWIGNLTMVGALACVIAISALTYRWIELPGQAWGRRVAEHIARQRSAVTERA